MWAEINSTIETHCRRQFESKFYADCILTAMREITTKIKAHVRRLTGEEIDGIALMRRAFSFNYNRETGNIERLPIILLVENLNSETNRNLQDGYMNIFVGAVSAFRNTKAHENLNPDRNRTIHMLFFCSLLMYKLDESNMNNNATQHRI